MTLWLACAPAPATNDPAWLVRASLDLRGVRPSPAELAWVAEHPERTADLVAGYAEHERVDERVQDLWAEVYRTRTETYHAAEHFPAELDEPAWQASIGEEALQLWGEIVREDLPVGTLVTADWTMADEALRAVLPVSSSQTTGWSRATWTDGRPAAGLLSTTGLWWRYPSTSSNAHRGRANAISRILLCEDHLDRPVEGLGASLSAEAEDAVTNAPACVACHATLDPLASYLYGFTWYAAFNAQEQLRYYPERERTWASWTGVEPSYFGAAVDGLDALGRAIADDPRFTACIAEQAFELLHGRDAGPEDFERLAELTGVLETEGRRLRPLLAAVVTSPSYREGGRLATAELLASQVEAATGYRWTVDDRALLETDLDGLRLLAGGMDGLQVTRPARQPNTTLVLAQQRLAESAAAFVRARGELPTGHDAGAVRAGVDTLHARVFGQPADDPSSWVALWEALDALDDDPAAAWEGVLVAMLRDPALLVY